MPRLLLLAGALSFAATPGPGASRALASAQDIGQLGEVRQGRHAVMPTVVEQALPDAPPMAPGQGRSQVVIEVVVATNGRVIQARPTPFGPAQYGFAKAALEAATRWRFRAPVVEGRYVPVLVLLEFTAQSDTPAVTGEMKPLPDLPAPRMEESALPAIVEDSAPGFVEMRLRRRVQAPYTSDAMRAKIQGTVVLELVVLSDGTVGAARVTRSLYPQLDRQALVAARYWLFHPATQHGTPVAARATLNMEFRLH